MDAFIVMLIKPFVAVPFLLVAWSGKKWVERWPDSRLKRILLFSWKA